MYWLVHFRLFVAKAILSQKWKGLAICLVVIIGGFVAVRWAGGHMSPYSVHVSGYYRSDGSYVSSHSRRSPGSRAHDAPYELVRSVAGLSMLGGLIGLIMCASGIREIDPFELLPTAGLTKPTKPKAIRVPSKMSVSRKSWPCTRCDTLIPKGRRYAFYMADKYGRSDRVRHCRECRDALLIEEQIGVEVARQYEKDATLFRDAMQVRFHNTYGIDPLRWGIQPRPDD